MSEVQHAVAEPGTDDGDRLNDVDACGENTAPAARPKQVEFGIDALGQWHVALRTHDGTRVRLGAAAFGPDGEQIDFSAHPVDSPAAAVELQAELQRRFPKAVIVWKPGVMDSLDPQRAAAQRLLASVAADRLAARKATAKADTSLRQALPLAVAAGMGPGEIAEHTGYARSTIAKAMEQPASPAGAAAADVPGPAASGE
ncbi:hypothetical protein ACWCQZ_46740 [Streptomyces sp. NPDC002285]